jgi:hypothetical protein
MPELLMIVARNEPKLYERLRLEFEGDEEVAVVLDRRLGDRRRRPQAVTMDQRRADRRRALADEQLKNLGWATARAH